LRVLINIFYKKGWIVENIIPLFPKAISDKTLLTGLTSVRERVLKKLNNAKNQ
jgi:hypothetical protein